MGRYLQLVVVLGMGWACAVAAQLQVIVPPEYERTGGPYVPTPNVVVERMLGMANVGERDHVIDLGSGDGIIVITAAQRLKASGYGVDIDEELVRLSNERAKKLGIDGRVRFEAKDIFQADVGKATVVTLYLLPDMMRRVRNKLYAELKPGARVVSHDYHFEEWQHDAEVEFEVPEKEFISGVPQATLYLWTVPAKINGAWRMQIDGDGEYELTLDQRYQKFEGAAVRKHQQTDLRETRLNGTEISFVLPLGPGNGRFTGRVDGDLIEGTVNLGGGKVVRWRALRGRAS
ncbi:MAG: class I SAM-dependent methyltransferase [Betaproteobacteria bacterium]|nr:class I SAM-dependent methyltransferase [Betaproteobacteria bacterium]